MGRRTRNIWAKIFNEGHIDWLDSSSDNLGGAQCQRIVLMYEKRDRNRRGQQDKQRKYWNGREENEKKKLIGIGGVARACCVVSAHKSVVSFSLSSTLAHASRSQ